MSDIRPDQTRQGLRDQPDEQEVLTWRSDLNEVAARPDGWQTVERAMRAHGRANAAFLRNLVPGPLPPRIAARPNEPEFAAQCKQVADLIVGRQLRFRVDLIDGVGNIDLDQGDPRLLVVRVGTERRAFAEQIDDRIAQIEADLDQSEVDPDE